MSYYVQTRTRAYCNLELLSEPNIVWNHKIQPELFSESELEENDLAIPVHLADLDISEPSRPTVKHRCSFLIYVNTAQLLVVKCKL
jgi:hypothetical protein